MPGLKQELLDWKEEHPLSVRAYQMRRKSKKLNQPSMTTLELEVWLDECGRYCEYCGRLLDIDKENHNQLDYFTIDRIEPTKGYLLSNIVPCCRRCNIIKGDWFSYKQMKEIGNKYLKN